MFLENDEVFEKVVKEVMGTEKKKLIPTEIGKITTGFLVENFSDILDYNFTATVEDHFDNIATPDGEFVYGVYERLIAFNAACIVRSSFPLLLLYFKL